jgi:hypothetical protein
MIKRGYRTITGAAAAAALLAGGLVALAPPASAAGHPPGVTGSAVVLGKTIKLVAYDVAANSKGEAYIAWISDDGTDPNKHRFVHFCALPAGASSCAYQTKIPALSDNSATDLKVLVHGNGNVELVWFHDTPNSINGPQNAEIAVATAIDGRSLSNGTDVASAPSFGHLLTAELAPTGEIWTVAYAGLGDGHPLQVRRPITAGFDSVSLPAGYGVADAELAFAGGKAVLTYTRYGSISDPVKFRSRSLSGGGWSSIETVQNTWTGSGSVALETTTHGMRLVTGVDDARYRAVISKWTGSDFTPRALTADADQSCSPSSHDGWADGSGRLLDVSLALCGKITVTNYADGYHAGFVRIGYPGVATFSPQIASGVRGIATLVYSVLGTTGHVLRVLHVRLPDPTRTVSDNSTGGRVVVTGPQTCLPPVNVHVAWSHPAANNWSFMSGSLRLGNTAITGTTLDGANLTPGTQYNLIGTATFARGSSRSTAKATLTFRTCGTG